MVEDSGTDGTEAFQEQNANLSVSSASEADFQDGFETLAQVRARYEYDTDGIWSPVPLTEDELADSYSEWRRQFIEIRPDGSEFYGSRYWAAMESEEGVF